MLKTALRKQGGFCCIENMKLIVENMHCDIKLAVLIYKCIFLRIAETATQLGV